VCHNYNVDRDRFKIEIHNGKPFGSRTKQVFQIAYFSVSLKLNELQAYLMALRIAVCDVSCTFHNVFLSRKKNAKIISRSELLKTPTRLSIG